MVPELVVTGLAASLRFWCGPCSFRVAYERPEDGFAYLDRGRAAGHARGGVRARPAALGGGRPGAALRPRPEPAGPGGRGGAGPGRAPGGRLAVVRAGRGG